MSMRYALGIALALFTCTAGSFAATPPDPAARKAAPPRLSFIEGEVSFWREGAEDWTAARRNVPIAQGDALYAAANANLEVQIGSDGFVRAGDDTEVSFETIEGDYLQLRVRGGHVAVDVQRLPERRRIEVDTPAAAFLIDEPGVYRVDVGPDQTRMAVRRGGPATATPGHGDPITVEDGREIAFAGDSNDGEVASAPAPDAWDEWSDARTREANEIASGESARHLPRGVYGAEDLDRNGSWREEPRYGAVWVPNSVPVGWAPYSTGRWIYDPYYGWTWIDDVPWGWAPFHYGRWVTVHGGWVWAPGPVVVTPFYSPALVAFFGSPGLSVSVSVGPTVGWVPLGWGEPLIPWWGHVGFVGVPCWHGWGGPRVVNNVVIQHNTYVNVRNINRYQNGHALVATNGRQFGHQGWERVAPGKHSLLTPIAGRVPMKPERESFAAGSGSGRRPPKWIEGRDVVATRQPGRLHPSESAAGHGKQRGAEPRLVSAPPPRWERAPQRPVHLRRDERGQEQARKETTASVGPETRGAAGRQRPGREERDRDTSPPSGWQRPSRPAPQTGSRGRERVTSEPGWGSAPPRPPQRHAAREPGFGEPRRQDRGLSREPGFGTPEAPPMQRRGHNGAGAGRESAPRDGGPRSGWERQGPGAVPAPAPSGGKGGAPRAGGHAQQQGQGAGGWQGNR